ncbi:Conserved_hypothetical protein [Hexamita inflata]|uniref:Uncharacterized protein n=1 Tax=Hexamita inflata TaxID=28002 RepID=A0AA86NSY6_9EUKA|nr:Conserved hypothetical protein [Hexamita inflata]
MHFIGTTEGNLIVLDTDMKKKKMFNTVEGRIKKIFQVEEDIFCLISSNGAIQIFGYDSEANEAFVVGEQMLVKRLVDGINVKESVEEEELAEAGEQGEEQEEDMEEELEEMFGEEEGEEEWEEIDMGKA